MKCLEWVLKKIFKGIPDDPCAYEGLDGLTRDISKLICEGEIWREHMAPEFARWREKPWSFHLMTNLWVEACRGSAYYFGHVLMMGFVLTGLLIPALSVLTWIYLAN